MSFLRNSAVAVTMIGAGLTSMTGMAFAHDGDTTKDSFKVLDASDSNNLSGNSIACQAEAALIQVNDAAANVTVPVLNEDSPTKTPTGNSADCNAVAKN